MTTSCFLGVCSHRGFVSRFDQLFPLARQLSILKGGCGCGKSTFMRSIDAAARERGLDTVTILCSSDPDSLDGLLIPALGAAFVDGTAPHVLEPRLCGGSMNYLNFGQFYDRQAMAANEEAVLDQQTRNAAQYPLATACLSAAHRVLDCVVQQTAGRHYDGELEAIAQCLALSILRPIGDRGSLHRCFLSALTPAGPHACLASAAALCGRVYLLRDSYGLAPRVLQPLLDRALDWGHCCVAGCSSQEPDRPVFLLLPTANTAILSLPPRQSYEGPSVACLDLDSTLPPPLREELGFALDTARQLQGQAVEYLRRAKLHHDRMEALCRPFIDYRAVTALTEQTIAQLFS